MQAGVVYTGNRSDINRDVDTRSGAVNGARSDQSNLTLDGVDVNDQVNGNAFTSVLPVSVDSVQEFRVTTSSYNADQGRSSGAQVSLVTKSGTNNFHGSLYEYHRNTLTSANDYFVKSSELQSGEPNVAPKLIRNIFGASVGGPIWKDRLFFFANYEGYRQAEEASEQRIVPSDTLRQGIGIYQYATSGDNVAINLTNDGNLLIDAYATGLGLGGVVGRELIALRAQLGDDALRIHQRLRATEGYQAHARGGLGCGAARLGAGLRRGFARGSCGSLLHGRLVAPTSAACKRCHPGIRASEYPGPRAAKHERSSFPWVPALRVMPKACFQHDAFRPG